MLSSRQAPSQWHRYFKRLANSNFISIRHPLSTQTLQALRQSNERPKRENKYGDTSQTGLFHRSVEFALREGPKRETRAMRKDGAWIPSIIQGRGKFPDMLIKVPLAPVLRDFEDRLFANSKYARLKWSGPLYELRPVANTEHDDWEWESERPDIPFERIRVKAQNMELNGVTEVPKTIAFLYCPEEEPVRVRVPIRYINEEKAEGLRERGYLNRIVQNVDVNVAPFCRAPLYAVQDVGGMKLKDRRCVGELMFKGKGMGCRTVLPDDVVATMISRV